MKLRRNQKYPLAQLVPVRRESYDGKWDLQDNTLDCVGAKKEKAVEIFDSWNAYNYKKWGGNNGAKDPATHNKERKKSGDKNLP